MAAIPIFLGIPSPSATEEGKLNGIAEHVVVEEHQEPGIAIQSFSNQKHSLQVIAHHPIRKIVCVADAYIANRRESLTRLGFKFKNREDFPDCQLILEAYQKWGITFVSELTGDFVCAIWDQSCDRFFLVRSPTSWRNLFYSRNQDGSIYFSNTIKLMTEQKHCSRRVNANKMASFLMLKVVHEMDKTFYHDILKIPSGHYLECVAARSPTLKRYWSVEAVQAHPLILTSCDDYYEAFRDLFQTVASDYIPTGQVFTNLSGGLDSSSVTAMAAHILQQQARSLIALGYIPSRDKQNPCANWNYSDQSYMEALVQKFNNITLHPVSSSKQLFFHQQYYSWLDEPVLNPMNITWMMTCVEKARASGSEAILVGQGGNFTISWPTAPFVSFSELNLWHQMRRVLSQVKQSCYASISPPPWQLFSAIHAKLAATYRKNFYIEERLKKTGDPRAAVFNYGMSDYAANFFSLTRHVFQMEHLDPTQDRRIMEFCLRIPLSILMKQGRSRLLVREGLKNIVPDVICERTTRGMQLPDWAIKFEQQKLVFKDWLHAWRHTIIAEFLDIPQLLQLLHRWDYARVEESSGKTHVHFQITYRHKFLRALEVGSFLAANRLV